MDRRSPLDGHREDAVGILDSQTPYQLTLKGLLFPWTFQIVLNAFAGLSLGLIGLPLLALVWTLVSCAADYGLQRLYARWWADAAAMDSARGLRRLTWYVFFRSTHSLAAMGYTALTALSMVALAVSCGWISRGVWAGIATPAVVAIGLEVLPFVGPMPALGLTMGVISFATTGILIALGTEKSLGEWSKANDRTRSVMVRLKEALSRSEAAERRLRIGAETAKLHLLEVDFVARTLVGQGAEGVFYEQPLTFEQFIADPFAVVAPEHRDQVVAAWTAYVAGLAPYHVQFRVNRSDREVWAYAKGEMTYGDEGQALALICALHDITELKRTELQLIEGRDRAEAGSRAKSEFLATMSHEIRTPLNGVLGMAQVMERERLTKAQRGRLAVIRKSGERLLMLLNSLLDLAKIEAGKVELEEGEVDIAAIAQGAIDTFESQATEKGVVLALRVQPAAQGVYAGDPLRVGQILHNLLSNAVKFTEAGSIEVVIDRTRRRLVIGVADTGIGVAPEKQPGLFEKFVQADASVTRRYGGSGLGLAICQQLAAMMGGGVSLRSASGEGSTFTATLDLPWLRPAAEASNVTPAMAEPSADLGTLHVLVVDDNPTNQLVLETLLQQVGIEPTVLGDGQQAVSAWESAACDLILMDIQMPVMDGVAATRRIREREAQTDRPRTPIVAITANVMPHQVEAYHAAGMDDVVAKPVSAGALLAAIAATLSGHVSSAGTTKHGSHGVSQGGGC